MQFIQNKIREVIVNQASNYFKDFDSENLSVAASQGDITLKNLELKENAIDLGDQAFKIVRGKFGKVDIKIPFQKLFYEPCTLEIAGVNLLVKLKDASDIIISKESEYLYIKNKFIEYVKSHFLEEIGTKQSGILDFWLIKNALERILDNLQVSIKRVNIDIVDNSTNNMKLTVHLSELELKTTDSNFMKEVFVRRGDLKTEKQIIYKRMIFSNFIVSLQSLDNSELGTQYGADGNKGDLVSFLSKSRTRDRNNLLFKFSFVSKIKLRPQPKADQPQYNVNISISTYELRITQWQVQKILVMLEHMKVFNQTVAFKRDRKSIVPEKRIKDIIKLHSDENETFESIQRKKFVISSRWWKYAILSVLKENRNKKKDQGKAILMGVVDSNALERIYQFKLPKIVTEVYYETIYKAVYKLIDSNFEPGCLDELENDTTVIDLKTALFSLNPNEQKSMALRVVKKIAEKEKMKMKATWVSWAKSYLPFNIAQTDREKSLREVKSLINEQIENTGRKFSNYMLNLNLTIKKASITLIGGSHNQRIEFRNNMKGIYLTVNSYNNALEADLKLKSFVFKFVKEVPFSDEEISFNILKSTVPDGGNFFRLSLKSLGNEKKSNSDVTIRIEHMDFFFLKNVFDDLQVFFTVEADKEMQDRALNQLNKLSKKGSATVSRNLSRKRITTTICAKIKSPRIVIPLTKSLTTLNADTNLFVLYLGDVNFKNVIKPTILTDSSSSYYMELLNFKFEFWEDYQDAIKALNYNTEGMHIANRDTQPKPNPSFVILDFSAFIEYMVKNNNDTSLNFISDHLDIRINNHIYNNIMEIPKLFEFKHVESVIKLQDQKNEIMSGKVKASKLAVKREEKGSYQYRYVVLSRETLYIFKSPKHIKPESKMTLSYANIDYFFDQKKQIHILRISKSPNAILIAFPEQKDAQDWANSLVDSVPTMKTYSEFNKKKLSETFKIDKKKTKLDFEVVISKCNLGLYDELYDKFLTLQIENLDSKFELGETSKIKISFCSLLALNCDKAFQSRDLTTLLYLGPNEAPKAKTVSRLVTEDAFNDTQKHSNTSFNSRFQSYRPQNNTSRLNETQLSHLRFDEEEQTRIEKEFNKFLPDIEEDGILRELDKKEESKLDISMMTKAPTIRDDYRTKFDKQTVLNTLANVKAQEKGALIYIEQDKKCQNIRIKGVNARAFFDAEYINKLLDLLNKFVAGKPKERNPFSGYKYEWKYLPKPKIDQLTQKITVNFKKICLIARTRSRNLFDIVLLKPRIQLRHYTTKIMNNIHIRRVAIRDLTNHPLTKKLHELQDYEAQPKNTFISFKESPKGKIDNVTDEKRLRLNKNGVSVIINVTRQEYRGRMSENVGTRAEVFLNNGEINLFIQPIFRLLDFIFFAVLPFITPDDTDHAPVKEIQRRLHEPSKNLYNVFARNLKVNLRPNFAVKKFPVLRTREMVVVNSIDQDQSRHISGPEKSIWSETISVDIVDPVIDSWDKEISFLKMGDLKVKFAKFGFKGNYERLMGKKALFEEIDVNNKIDVVMQNFDMKARRDDFYAFMTFNFGSLSWNDEMDDLLLITPFDNEGPHVGMDIRVLSDGFKINFLDDRKHVFLDLGFEEFYAEVNRDHEKNQDIQIYGKGLDSNAYSYKQTDKGSIKKIRFPFLKIMKNIEDMVNYHEEELKKVFIPKSHFQDKRILDEEDIKQMLDEARSRYNPESEFPVEFRVSMEMAKEGHKDISVNLANIGLSVITPIIFAGKKLTQMTWDMAMNSLIRPTLTKYFGDQRTYVNISDLFLFLLPNNGIDFNMIAHIPEVYVVYSKLWEKTEIVKEQILMYFDKSEFDDHQYQALDPLLLDKSNIYHMAVELIDTTMYLVDDDDISKFCLTLIENKLQNFVYHDINARMVMSPINQIGYHMQTNSLTDKFKEIFFSRGVARIGKVLLTVTTYDLHYLLRWTEYMDRKYWKNIKIGDSYEEYIKSIMNDLLPADWLKHIQKTYKKKLDIMFGGLKLLLLDDVYDTNIELLKFYIHPISTTQIQGYKTNGFSDIYTKLEAEYYNYNCKEWEPFLENFNFTLRQTSSEEYGSVTQVLLNDENACINLSTELLCIAQGIQKQRQLRLNYYQAKEVIDKIRREILRQERRKLRKYQNQENIDFSRRNSVSMNFRPDETSYMSRISDSNFSRSFMHQKSYGPDGQFKGHSIIDHGNLNLTKNPLQYQFASKKNNNIGEDDFFNRDSALYASEVNNILNTTMNSNKKQLKLRHSKPKLENRKPTKEKIQQLIEKSKFQFNDEINLKECPLFVRNMIGYDIIFHLNFNETVDSFYVPNLKMVGVPYPYHIHKEFSRLNNDSEYTPQFAYYIYILNKKDFSLTELYSSTSIIPSDSFKIEVENFKEGVYETSNLYINNRPNIMRELVTIRSQFVIVNEINPDVIVDINNGMNGLRLSEHESKPIFFNCVDYDVSIIAQLEKKPGTENMSGDYEERDFMKDDRFDDIDVRDEKYQNLMNMNVMKQAGHVFSLKEAANDDDKIFNYKVNEHFAFNIFIEDDENHPETKNLVLVPPLLIKNRVFSDINFYIVKKNFGRNFDEKHQIRFEEEDFEIYDTLGDKLKVRIGIRRLISDVIRINLKDREKITKESVWLYQNEKKKIELNLIGRFERGSYIIDVFMKAILVDELFMNLNYSQNVGISEEVLQPINKEVYSEGRRAITPETYEKDESLMTEEDRFKEGLKEAKKFSSNLKLSNVYFLQLNDALHVSDAKYIYESKTIETNKIGNKDYRIFYFNNENKCAEYYDIVACVYNHTFISDQLFATKVVHLKPKYIIENDSKHVFTIVQSNTMKKAREIILANKEKSVLFSNDKTSEYPNIRFRIPDHSWSDNISFDKPMLIFLALRENKQYYDEECQFTIEAYTPFNIQMTFSADSYLLLLRQKENLSPFKIKNIIPDCILLISQNPKKLGKNFAESIIYPGEEKYYCWPNPFSKPQKLYAALFNRKYKEFSKIFEINKDKQNDNYDIIFELQARKIYHFSKVSGIGNELIISDVITDELFQAKINSRINFRCPNLGVSVLGGKNEKRREMLYLKMKDFDFMQETTKDETRQQIALRYLNIDNNSDVYACFPVVFTPKNPLNYIERNGLRHLDIYVKSAISEHQIKTYNLFQVEMLPSIINLEEELIEYLLDMKGELDKDSSLLDKFIKEKYKKFSTPHDSSMKTDYDKKLKDIVKENWKLRDFKRQDQENFVNNLSISELNFLLSFQKHPGESNASYAKWMNNVAFDFLGAIITNIEDAPIDLGAVNSHTQSLPMSLAMDIAKAQYYEDIKSSLIKILGSLNVIGNPQQLFREITAGVQDFVDKPLDRAENKGLMPLSVGTGLLKGTGSLVTHTVGGAFGSVNKISKTVADGISAIHIDKEYNEKRVKMRFAKTNGLLENLNKSMKQVGTGLVEGVKGVFLKPIEYGAKDGATGVLKGAYMGVTGLIVKPVAGVLDAASTLTGHISKSSKLEREIPNDERVRPPRAFYGENRAIKNYKKKDASVHNIVTKTYGKEYEGYGLERLTEVYDGKMTNPKIFTYNRKHLCNIDYNSRKPDWIIKKENYRGFEVRNNEILLREEDEVGNLIFKKIFAYDENDRNSIADYLMNYYPRYNY